MGTGVAQRASGATSFHAQNILERAGTVTHADPPTVCAPPGDSEQLVRVRTGVPQRTHLQVSLLQLHVSEDVFKCRH